MIIIVGDVHGHTKTYQKFIKTLPSGQRSIQVGDMGLGFSGVGLHPMSDEHKFFRGNHDSPEKCRAHKNYLGDFGFEPETGIFWLAGAFSMDRAWRVQGVSYWIDEELGFKELDDAIKLYTESKPRFVLSHEAPSKAGQSLLYQQMGSYFVAKGEGVMSRTAQALQSMLDIHQPEQWIFGHYHVDKSFEVPGYVTKFRCVGGMMADMDKVHTYELETI